MVHTIEPVYDAQSKILILGSFPSVKSREMCFSTDISRTVSGKYWRRCWNAKCRKISRRRGPC